MRWTTALAIMLLCAVPAAADEWQCGAAATCSHGHPIVSWQWSDNGAGGSFSDPALPNPVYTAAPNYSGAPVDVTLTVTATCAGDPEAGVPAASGHDDVVVTVQPVPHTIDVEATAEPIQVALGESSQLHAEARDAAGPVAWEWAADGRGEFEPSPRVADPRYWPADTGRVPVRVSGMLEGPYLREGEAGLVLLALPADGAAFPDVPPDHWAYDQVMDVYWRGIVQGYEDGTYQPAWPVTRDQMAVFLSRAFDYLGAPDPEK